MSSPTPEINLNNATDKPNLPDDARLSLTNRGKDELLNPRVLHATVRRFLLLLDASPLFAQLRTRLDLMPDQRTFDTLVSQGYLQIQHANSQSASNTVPFPVSRLKSAAPVAVAASATPAFQQALGAIERDIAALFDKDAPALIEKLYRLQSPNDLLVYVTKLRGILSLYHDVETANAFEARAMQRLSSAM